MRTKFDGDVRPARTMHRILRAKQLEMMDELRRSAPQNIPKGMVAVMVVGPNSTDPLSRKIVNVIEGTARIVGRAYGISAMEVLDLYMKYQMYQDECLMRTQGHTIGQYEAHAQLLQLATQPAASNAIN